MTQDGRVVEFPNPEEHQQRAYKKALRLASFDLLPVHPAAELFPIMTDAELVEMGNDIKKHGLRESIAIYVDPNGKEWLLDARNRLKAMEIVGIEFKLQRYSFGWEIAITSEGDEYDAVRNLPDTFGTRIVQDIDPYDYVISANIRRRHLTSEQKRELIGSLLKADPGKSNREIGSMIKADDKTVGTVRHKLEASAEIPHIDHPKTTNKAKKSRGRKLARHRQAPAAPESSAQLPKPAQVDLEVAASAAAATNTVAEVDPAATNTNIAVAELAKSPDDTLTHAEIAKALRAIAARLEHFSAPNWEDARNRVKCLLSRLDPSPSYPRCGGPIEER
jgi:hypothetical protein